MGGGKPEKGSPPLPSAPSGAPSGQTQRGPDEVHRDVHAGLRSGRKGRRKVWRGGEKTEFRLGSGRVILSVETDHFGKEANTSSC